MKFSELSTSQLKQMKKELKQAIFRTDCYSWKDFEYLFAIQEELEKRK